jgi:protein phosphatase
MRQLEKESPEFRQEMAKFLDGLISHYVFDDGKLVVAHAGLKESMQGRGSGGVREFALFGETTGETDEFGLPVRYNWAADYRGKALVVYGHTPQPEPLWLNTPSTSIQVASTAGVLPRSAIRKENSSPFVPARHTTSRSGRFWRRKNKHREAFSRYWTTFST